MAVMTRASGLRGYRELVRELGGNPVALLESVGVPPSHLDDDDALVPMRSFLQLLEDAARTCGTMDFGMRMGAHQDITVLGPLAVAMQNAATPLEAMHCASRFLFVQSPGIALDVVEQSPHRADCAEVRYEVVLPRVPPHPQVLEHGLLVAHRIMRRLIPEAYRAEEIHLPHAALSGPAAYGRYFHAPLRHEQSHAAILVRRSVLQMPMKTINDALREMAMAYIDVHYPRPGQSVSARVRQAVSRSLTTGMATQDQVADMMAMHPRTLRRRLVAEGTGFERILDDVRREAAARYLTTTQMPMNQVSNLLGFSAQSAFTRCCRRWFGMSPRQVRQAGGTPAPHRHAADAPLAAEHD